MSKNIEEKILEDIFTNLEKVTERFTKEDSVFFGVKSAGSDSRITSIPINFQGFSRQPSKYLSEILHKKYPSNEGNIIFYVMDNVISYHKKRC